MEWCEFQHTLAQPNMQTLQARLQAVTLPFEPQWVLWFKYWSFRRSSKSEVKRAVARIHAMLNEQCEGRWYGFGNGIYLFSHKADAALAKLSWPEDLK